MEFTLPVRLPAKAPGKSGRLDLGSRIADARDARARAQERRVRLPCMIADFPRKSKRNRRAGGVCMREICVQRDFCEIRGCGKGVLHFV